MIKFHKNNIIFSYLFGLIRCIIKIEDKKMIIKIGYLKILEGEFEKNYLNVLLFNFIHFEYRGLSISFFKRLIAAYLYNKYKIKNTDIIAFFCYSGETFFTLSYFDEFAKKYNIQNPVIVSIYPHYKEIVNMLLPKAKFIVLPNIFPSKFKNIKNDKLDYNINYFNFLPNSYFINYERKLHNNQRYFLDELRNNLNIENDKNIATPQISKLTQKEIDGILNKLNIKKFIYIIPFANSCQNLDDLFWKELIVALYNKGYDVICNSALKRQFTELAYNFMFSLEGARHLASKAECVIGVRSGLFDIIMQDNIKVHCIYADFKERSVEFPKLEAQKVLDAFTLSKLPNIKVNCLYEYTIKDDLLEEILDRIE